MKIEYIDDNNFIIYLNKYYVGDLDIKEKYSIEEYFRKMFLSLKNNYHIDIYGYYDIRVYANNQYGLIIDIQKIMSDFYKIYNNKVEMKITIEMDNLFLYEINDYFFIDELDTSLKNVYYKDKKYYIELDGLLEETKYNRLLENSNIIYDDKVQEVIMSSIKIL